jgi:hypothetical protein
VNGSDVEGKKRTETLAGEREASQPVGYGGAVQNCGMTWSNRASCFRSLALAQSDATGTGQGFTEVAREEDSKIQLLGVLHAADSTRAILLCRVVYLLASPLHKG